MNMGSMLCRFFVDGTRGHFRERLKRASIAGAFLLAQSIAAGSVLDFEGLADSDPLTTQLAGLTFT